MPIVGTAGHVDHGKSTLVRALTGIDPDRWAEEKERGLTIDLGFAWAELGGHDVGFVDVPGHERFIKNMLAGVGVLDCALFVVAADSGWMPQSEEHAAVLDLLEVDRGVIALSRVDLVDEDIRELATLDVLERVEGTRLEGWPIVPVSPVSGEGMEAVRDAIVEAIESGPERPSDGFRMWVDRAFRPAGAGLVVTGTVLEGAVAEGDRLLVLPHGAVATVRGIQHHGGPTDVGVAGSRTAINLTGAPDDVDRGTLLTAEDTVAVTDRVLAALHPTRAIGEIPARGAFHLHIGTTSATATIRRIRSTDAYVLSLESRLPMVMGDRVIIRETGRRAVVGGGIVLDPLPGRHTAPGSATLLEEAVRLGRTDMANALVDVHGMLDAADVRRASGGGHPSSAVRAGSRWIAPDRIEELGDRLATMVDDYHERHPRRPGVPKSEAASRMAVTADVVDAIVDRREDIGERSGCIARQSFRAELDATETAAWETVRRDLEATFDVPRASAIDLDPEVVHLLIRRGDLVRITEDLVFTSAQAAAIIERVAELPEGFTVAEFRDHFGMARRQAVPTLEWLDGIGRTRRDGDGRTVRGDSGGP